MTPIEDINISAAVPETDLVATESGDSRDRMPDFPNFMTGFIGNGTGL